jgi:hypothetical protein
MAGEKQTIEIDLNPDQIAFIGVMKDEYDIASESKVMRIIMDYLHQTKISTTTCSSSGDA